MVAGEGLDTRDLRVIGPALCGTRKSSSASLRTIPPPFDRGSFRVSLSPPPAAVGTKTQRATLVGLIAKGHSCKSFRRNETRKNDILSDAVFLVWLREKDLNQRPSGYEPDELPTAPSRDILFRFLRSALLVYHTSCTRAIGKRKFHSKFTITL